MYLHIYKTTTLAIHSIYIYCDRTPPWFPTTCNIFWYKDFLCCFFRFSFVRISSDFSSGALWQNVLPQYFFVRILSELELKQRNLWRNLNDFFCGKMLWQNVLPQKNVEISSKTSLKFRQTWVEATKSLTKFQRNSHDHFLWQKVWQNGLPQGLPRNLQRKL